MVNEILTKQLISLKIIKKPSCANCLHKEVCSIYGYAKEYNKTSPVKFAPHTMVEVCKNYLKNCDL